MVTSDNPDSTIISQLKHRDQLAIANILTKYGDTLYGIIYHKVQSESTANVIMKKVFINVWQNAPQYDETADSLFAWLIKMVKQTTNNTIH